MYQNLRKKVLNRATSIVLDESATGNKYEIDLAIERACEELNISLKEFKLNLIGGN